MRHSGWTLGLATVLVASPARAQGFGIYEHGTCAMGRAGAVVAKGCGDGSSMFYNPSGMPGRLGLTVTGGVTLIDAVGNFKDDATATQTNLANDPIPVPHLFVQYGINDGFAVGVGVFVPYGLGTKWPTTFEGRFNGYDNSLSTFYIQPTVAWAVTDRIGLGAGLDIAVGSVELNQYADLSESNLPGLPITFAALGVPFHTQFATANLKASGATGIGGNFGATIKATDWLTLGARYTMRITLDYSGTATFAPAPTGIVLPAGNPFGAPAGTPLDSVVSSAFGAGGPLVTQAVTTSITLPDQLVAGVNVTLSPRLDIEADYQWVRWSLFAALPVNFPVAPSRTVIENYQNTHGLRLGAQWAASDKVTLRGGWIHHGGAAPDETVTPLLPEGQRNEFAAGLGWAMSDALSLNLAYQFIRQDNRRGRVQEASGGAAPTTALNSGLYEFAAHLVGATFTLHF